MQLFLLLLLGALGYSLAYQRSYSYEYPRRRAYSPSYSSNSYSSLSSRKAKKEITIKGYGMTPLQMMCGVNLFSSIFTGASLSMQGGFMDSLAFATEVGG